MRKLLLAFMSLIIIISLSGCEEKLVGSPDSDSGFLSSLPGESQTEPFGAETSFETPSPQEPSSTPADGDAATAQIFRTFLSDNYDRLMEAGHNTIAGIGFIDLDLDGARELIVFDAGASASMGVQIFDIVDGKVICVSANVEAIREAFGIDSSNIIINANFMEDFRLMENKATGERFFVVESANGNIESVYSELIRFGSSNGTVTLSSVFTKLEEYDTETGEVKSHSFRIGSADAKLSEYTAAFDAFYAENTDLGLEFKGVFVWENNEYVENHKNFMSMVDKALELSVG